MPLRFTLYLIICVIAGAFVACDSPAARLREIDNIIEPDPAGAYEALDTMNLNGFDAADSAYYALLYTQARIKCKLPVESDSLITKAYRHYIHSGNENLRMRAAFYKAQIAYDYGELSSAMKDVLIAYEIAKGNQDAYWTAKTAEVIGDIYFDSYNYWQAEKYTAEAARCYLAAGKILNHRYALTDRGITYIAGCEVDKGLALLDSLLGVIKSETPLDSALYDYIMSNKYVVEIDEKRKNEIGDYHLKTDESLSIANLVTEIVFDALQLAEEDNFAKADSLLGNLITKCDDDKDLIRVKYAQYRILLMKKEYKQAALLGDSILLSQSAIVSDILMESLPSIERDFYENKTIIQEQRARVKSIILCGLTIFFIIVVLLLIWIYNLRLKNKKKELENTLLSLYNVEEFAANAKHENSRLNIQLTEKTSEINRLESQLDQLSTSGVNEKAERIFREKWKTLNVLCNEYFSTKELEQSRDILYNKIVSEIKRISSKKSLEEIEASINMYMANIMQLVRDELPKLSEEEYKLLILIYAGFSSRAICLFTNIEYKNFYQRKKRLIDKIRVSGVPHADYFIDKMNK